MVDQHGRHGGEQVGRLPHRLQNLHGLGETRVDAIGSPNTVTATTVPASAPSP